MNSLVAISISSLELSYCVLLSASSFNLMSYSLSCICASSYSAASSSSNRS
nr:MAG TPA: hypothetical protein [Caudoviricetes sp.]